MSIQLKPEQERRIADALRSGAYDSEDQVIDRALDVLREQDEWLSATASKSMKTFALASLKWSVARAFPEAIANYRNSLREARCGEAAEKARLVQFCPCVVPSS